jgi:cell division protein FtsQ
VIEQNGVINEDCEIMTRIERRRPNRGKSTGKRVPQTKETARNRRASRSATLETARVDAAELLKTVGQRIFGVQVDREPARRRVKSSERRIRSDSFASSRSIRKNDGMPPVLVRRGLADMATPSRRVRAPRRRYDVALNVPGAEVRLPSLPSIQFGWRLLSGLILVMMIASAYMLLSTPTFQVDLVEVEGLEHLSLSDLDLVLGITGESIVSLDAVEIRQTLLDAFHGIREVQVQIGLPASVQLTVRERQPVAAWVYQDEIRWFDQDGIVYEPGELDGELPLTVHAEILPLQYDPGLAKDATSSEPQYERFDPELVRVIKSMSDYLPAEAVMVYDDNHGLGWTDGGGWQVYFGTSLNEIDQKLIVYQNIAQLLETNGIQPSMISVEYLHAPFYRMER